MNGRASQTGRSFEPKWTVQEDSGRSMKIVNGPLTQSGRSWVEDFDSKWTVIRLKVDGPDESKDKSGRYKNDKVDGSSILIAKADGLKFKVDGLKV